MDTHHDNYLETPESHSNALESMRMCQIEIL